MWYPVEELDWINREIVKLEQAYLAVLRKDVALTAFLHHERFADLFQWIDDHPHQAFLMARIKSSHAMVPRHGINVMLMARAWAKTCHRLGTKMNEFSLAALIHDIGHWIPKSDLVYVFDAFSHDQFRSMQAHSLVDLSAETAVSEDMRLWISQHHEQPDGGGYPHAIKNPHPLSQCLRIVDCFEGLTTARRARRAYPYSEAMKLMRRWRGYKFDAGLFKSFEDFVGAFPVGEFVRLKSGEAGAILPGTGLKECKVLLLKDREGEPLAEAETKVTSFTDIDRAANRWEEPSLPEAWQGLRPDLLSLPRAYT